MSGDAEHVESEPLDDAPSSERPPSLEQPFQVVSYDPSLREDVGFQASNNPFAPGFATDPVEESSRPPETWKLQNEPSFSQLNVDDLVEDMRRKARQHVGNNQ